MERIKNFDEFYEIKLKCYLDDLRKQNKKADYWGIAIVVSALLIIPVLVFGLSDLSGSFGGWIIVWGIATLILCVYNYTKSNDDYESNFKEQVIRQIIEFINPGLVYKPDVYINSSYYKNSSLFRYYYDDYDGDDLIEGTYKNVPFKCSELNVSSRSGSMSRSDNYLFKGLFFGAPVNSRFAGGTYIWLKGNEQLPATIADERYRLMPMPHSVRVDCRNGDFEKHYVVYTTDVNEASTIVDTQMMQCIMDFKRQINRNFTLSFVAGMCYVAIPFSESLLEPQSGDPSDKTAIQNYFFTVLLVLSIINKLQLERLQ